MCKDNGLLNVLNANITKFIILTKKLDVENKELFKAGLTTLNKDGTLKATDLSKVFSDNVDYNESYLYNDKEEVTM